MFIWFIGKKLPDVQALTYSAGAAAVGFDHNPNLLAQHLEDAFMLRPVDVNVKLPLTATYDQWAVSVEKSRQTPIDRFVVGFLGEEFAALLTAPETIRAWLDEQPYTSLGLEAEDVVKAVLLMLTSRYQVMPAFRTIIDDGTDDQGLYLVFEGVGEHVKQCILQHNKLATAIKE